MTDPGCATSVILTGIKVCSYLMSSQTSSVNIPLEGIIRDDKHLSEWCVVNINRSVSMETLLLRKLNLIVNEFLNETCSSFLTLKPEN